MQFRIKLVMLTAVLTAIALLLGYHAGSAAPASNPQPPAPAVSALAPAAVPPRDRDPQPAPPAVQVHPDVTATWLVHPDGSTEPILFDHDPQPGDEIATTYPVAHVWRVTRTRYELYETYTARLIYVAELLPNADR